jgi:TRAP-type C4-dicarboxylate transport system substrate-binding protein
MKMFARAAALAGVCAALLAAGAMASSADTLIRWTEGSPDRGARAEAYHWFADTVTKRTNGEVKFQFYFGGALMGHAANVSGIGSGAADMGQIIAAYTPKELLAYSVGDLPLVDSDPWVGVHAMYDLATSDATLKKMFDDLNLVYVSNQTTGPIQLVCKGKDIKTLADLKGVKVRGSGVYSQAFSDLGANVISLSQEDVYSALQNGLADCNQQYIQGVIPYRQQEVTDQLVLLNWGQILGFGLVMNKDTFNSLTKEQQDIVMQTGREFLDHYTQIVDRDVHQSLKDLQDPAKGYHMTITKLGDADKAELRKVGQHYLDSWVKNADKAGYAGDQLLKSFLSLTDKYQAELQKNGYPWLKN